MRHPELAGVFLLLLLPATAVPAEFDRLEADRLAALAAGPDARPQTSLTVNALEALPSALADTRAAFLIAKTGQGNLARLLVSPALRKPPKDGEPVPVLLVERFDTFEPGRSSSRVARGSGTILFDGFFLDLDAGVVVPEGQGGDLVFRATGPAGPRLEVVPGTTLVSLAKPVPPLTARGGPSPGKTVLPGDLAGRYRLHADGRWTGLLELRVDEDRVVSGLFRSEPNGTSYPVSGQVAADPPNRATFTVKFPRTEHEYDAYLWTEGKSTLAGTFVMRGRTFGFYAVREGTATDAP